MLTQKRLVEGKDLSNLNERRRREKNFVICMTGGVEDFFQKTKCLNLVVTLQFLKTELKNAARS